MNNFKTINALILLLAMLLSPVCGSLFAKEKSAYEVKHIIESEQLVSVIYEDKLYALGKGDTLPGTEYTIDAIAPGRVFLSSEVKGGEQRKQAILNASGFLIEINKREPKSETNQLLRPSKI